MWDGQKPWLPIHAPMNVQRSAVCLTILDPRIAITATRALTGTGEGVFLHNDIFVRPVRLVWSFIDISFHGIAICGVVLTVKHQ
jgi:hypothetical protein